MKQIKLAANVRAVTSLWHPEEDGGQQDQQSRAAEDQKHFLQDLTWRIPGIGGDRPGADPQAARHFGPEAEVVIRSDSIGLILPAFCTTGRLARGCCAASHRIVETQNLHHFFAFAAARLRATAKKR
jgi:hypothetical protein